MIGRAFHLPQAGSQVFGPELVKALPGFGLETLDALLPLGGLPCAALTEIQATGAAAGATSLALRAVRAAQGEQRGRSCAFVDPSGTLFSPAAEQMGVELERLLVVRPRWEELESVCGTIADARLVSLLVVDLRGGPSSLVQPANDAGLVARLSIASEATGTPVLLLARGPRVNDPLAPRIALCLTVARIGEHALQIGVAGRMLRAQTRVIPWSLLVGAELEASRGAQGG
jgi:hypothetical protein